MKNVLFLRGFILFLVLTTVTSLSAAEKGWLGLVFYFKGNFFSHVVESGVVTAISPNSPADGHQIAIGDALIEFEGLTVHGAKLSDLRAKGDFAVGQVLHLKFKRASGDI